MKITELPHSRSYPGLPYRTDHSDGYGGILIGVRAELAYLQIVLVTFVLSQELIIIGIYTPPNQDILYQQDLCTCICEIVRKHPNAFILCAGDLILPDINWSNESITDYRYPLAIKNSSLSMSADCCFTQLVDFPTCKLP